MLAIRLTETTTTNMIRVIKYLLLATLVFFRVNYSIRGDGHHIYIPAHDSQEARQIVERMFPGSLVTGVFREETI